MEVPVSEEVKRRICEAEEAILTSVETIFTDAGLVTDTDVVQGMPAEQISLYAEKGGYDLIVMGRPNAGKTPGFFSKDVIDQVLHTVKCPVLIVQG